LQVRASSASSWRRSLHVAAALRPRAHVAVQPGRLAATRRLDPRPPTMTTERSRHLAAHPGSSTNGRSSRASGPSWSTTRPTSPLLNDLPRRRPGPTRRLAAACPTAALHDLPVGHSGRGNGWTPDVHTGHRTPDAGRLDAQMSASDTGQRSRGRASRGHWTLAPDTGHRTPDAGRGRGHGD